MTDHRRRAEKLYDIIAAGHCADYECHNPSHHYQELREGRTYLFHKKFGLNELESALKEVEEETFARAVGSLEALMPEGSYTTEDMLVIHKRYLDTLREEAAKK